MTVSPEPTPDFVETVLRIPIPGADHTVYGILTQPIASLSPSSSNAKPYELALVAHGFAGHKDYCYLKLLAHTLPTKASNIEMATFRFDFSGCADSEVKVAPGEEPHKRTLQSDLRDLTAIACYMKEKYPNLLLTTTVCHSRGSLSALVWLAQIAEGKPHPPSPELIEATKSITRVVNCAGRFRAELLLSAYDRYIGFRKNAGFYENARLAGGKYGPMWSSYEEIQSMSDLSVPDSLDAITKYMPNTRFLSIYGELDTIIPQVDPGMYHTHLSTPEHPRRHELKLIANADHNYYGKPRHSGEKKANYNPTVVQLIMTWLQDSSH